MLEILSHRKPAVSFCREAWTEEVVTQQAEWKTEQWTQNMKEFKWKINQRSPNQKANESTRKEM